jgi:hypothetical protein
MPSFNPRYLIAAGVAAAVLITLHFTLPQPFEARNETRELDAAQIQSVFTYDLPPVPADVKVDQCILRINPGAEPSSEERLVGCRLTALPGAASFAAWIASLTQQAAAQPLTGVPDSLRVMPVGAEFPAVAAYAHEPIAQWYVDSPLVVTNEDRSAAVVYMRTLLVE